jgi:thiol:disulfide interchange protein DsbD
MAPVPRGHAFEIAVVAKITAGYHVNAHVPSEEYLIPTKVTADLPSGVTLVVTAYPRGMVHQFQFAPAGLRVYEGSFTVRMRLRAAANAPLGQQKIPLTVAYQACNQEACLPPTKVPAVAEFAVAAEDAPSHPANPEVFSENTKTPAAH